MPSPSDRLQTSVVILICTLFLLTAPSSVIAADTCEPIDYPKLLSIPERARSLGLPKFVGSRATPNTIAPVHIPPNPFLADQGQNSLHGDTYNTDTLNFSAPLGKKPIVSSRALSPIAATCPTVVFDPHGNVITVCIGIARVRLFLMHPHTLEVLAEQELPLRAWVAAGRPQDITTDSSGGGYFHVDSLGRALVGVANQHIQRWQAVEGSSGCWEWQLVDDIDLTTVLNNPDAPLQDAIPDYSGRLWFTTQPGIVGYLNESTNEAEVLELGEFLQNGFAVDTDGAIYAVTVEALYRLSVGADGSIDVDWRQPYLNDGGQGGLLSQGSGTTPTLLGQNNDLITIADNSADRIHLNVYMRHTGEQICEFPMFGSGASATENSPIGYGNDIVLENNAGYAGPFGNPLLTVAGLQRIRVRDDYSGCDLVWSTKEFKAQTTTRLSTETGLVYTYSVKPGPLLFGFLPTFGWYFGALDWETGDRVFEAWVGNGPQWNNVLDPVTIGPDGTAYVGTLSGIMSIRDR